MGIGGWRKSAGGRLSEVGERWVKGDWSVACPCASSTPLLSVFFFSLLSVVSGSLPRPPQTSPWAAARRTVLSFSRRQPQTELPCPLDINQHAFLQAPSTHTHTNTHSLPSELVWRTGCSAAVSYAGPHLQMRRPREADEGQEKFHYSQLCFH